MKATQTIALFGLLLLSLSARVSLADGVDDMLSLNAVRAAERAMLASNQVLPAAIGCIQDGTARVVSAVPTEPRGIIIYKPKSPEIHLLMGGHDLPGTGEHTSDYDSYAYEVSYETPMYGASSLSVNLLNRGHGPTDHPDGFSAQAWGKLSAFNDRVRLGAGIGPELEFDTVPKTSIKGFSDEHPVDLLASLSAQVRLTKRLSLEGRVNWVPLGGALKNDRSVLVGVSYSLPTVDEQDSWSYRRPASDDGQRDTPADHRNQISLAAGKSIYNSMHSQSGSADNIAYTRQIAGPLAVTASYLNEGDNKLFHSDGEAIQLVLKQSIDHGKFDFGVGYGIYDNHLHSDVTSVPSERKLDQLITLSTSYDIGDGWRVGLQMNRDKSPSSKNPNRPGDSDILMLTAAKGFNVMRSGD